MTVEDVTHSAKDWEDFWYAPEKMGTWSYEEFEKIWWEMEAIEPLTP